MVLGEAVLRLRVEIGHEGDFVEELLEAAGRRRDLRHEFAEVLETGLRVLCLKRLVQVICVEELAEILDEQTVFTSGEMRRRALERQGEFVPGLLALRTHHRVEVHAVHRIRGVERMTESLPVLPGRVLAHTRQKLDQTQETELGGGIHAETQERKHVLHVQLLEHTHAARDAKRDAIAREGHLDVNRGVVRSIEDRNILVGDAVLSHRVHQAQDGLGLGTSVVDVVEARLRRGTGAERTQRLFELVLYVLHHAVGDIKNRGHRAIVPLELDDPATVPPVGEVHDVLELRAAPGVDALEVVTHHHDVAVLGGDEIRELGLNRVRVLILIDEHVEEVFLQKLAHAVVLREQAESVHEQVVEVHRAEFALLRLVGAAHLEDERRVNGGLRLVALHDLLKVALAVRRVAHELEQKLLLLEILDVLDILLDALPHDLLLVVLVEDREAGLVSKAGPVLAQEPRADMVESAAPHAAHSGDERLGALEHLPRGAVRERQQEDALRRNAVLDEVGDAVDERAGLARAGCGEHEHGAVRRGRGGALFGVEDFREIDHD